MIRYAERADAPAIAEIWNQVIRDTTHTFTTVEKTHEDITTMIGAQTVLVAHDTVVSGFATYAPFRSGPGYARSAEHSVYAAQSGRGIGRALLTMLERRAAAKGIAVFVAGIGGENAAAIAFHSALGYVQTGHLREVGEKFGRKQDLIFMQKNLGLRPDKAMLTG